MRKEYLQVDCSVKDCLHFDKCCKTCTELCYLDKNKKIDVLFIGQGAGRDEDITLNPTNIHRQPFYGKSGRYLRGMIKYLWENEEVKANVAFSNTIRCHPVDEHGKNRDPDEHELNMCKINLFNDIQKINPSFIILLGKSTSTALYPAFTDKTMGFIRGKTKQLLINNIQYNAIPTYHPSYLARQFGSFKPTDVNDMNISLTLTLNDIKIAMSYKPEFTLF